MGNIVFQGGWIIKNCLCKNIKACIFDLDGVLVDTAKYHYLAWKRLASDLGFEFTEADNERLKGISRLDSLEILLSIGNISFDMETKLRLTEKKNAWYVQYISKMTKDEVLPGAVNFLRTLKQAGIKISLGSVSKNARQILNAVDLFRFFDVVIDGTKIAKAKPDPEVFLKGAAALNISPKNCVVFEDAAAGIQAAINAGMFSIGIGSPVILKAANRVIPSFEGVDLSILQF